MSQKAKKAPCVILILAVIFVAAALCFDSILNVVMNQTMGKDLPQLEGSPEVGEWYAIDIDNAVSSDGSKWQGYLRKGSENKVVVYFYGGGFSVNDYTAARSLDVEGGFYNPRLNTGLNVMTTAIRKWGIGNSSEDNMLRDWTFVGIPYCNGDFHAGTGEKEYTALDGTTQTIYYHGYQNYRLMMEEVLKYIDHDPEQLLITGSSAGGFGAAILADDVMDLFPNTKNVTVHVDSSLLITDNWHNIMVEEWHTPEKFSSVVTTDNITLDSLAALHQKWGDAVKILFDCSVRDYNLSMAQMFFDEGFEKSTASLQIGDAEGDRFQKLLKEMADDMQEQIPGCGIYIWDEETQADGHLTVHTATGTKIYFDSKSRNPSIAQWLEDAISGNVESYGLDLLDYDY